MNDALTTTLAEMSTKEKVPWRCTSSPRQWHGRTSRMPHGRVRRRASSFGGSAGVAGLIGAGASPPGPGARHDARWLEATALKELNPSRPRTARCKCNRKGGLLGVEIRSFQAIPKKACRTLSVRQHLPRTRSTRARLHTRKQSPKKDFGIED